MNKGMNVVIKSLERHPLSDYEDVRNLFKNKVVGVVRSSHQCSFTKMHSVFVDFTDPSSSEVLTLGFFPEELSQL